MGCKCLKMQRKNRKNSHVTSFKSCIVISAIDLAIDLWACNSRIKLKEKIYIHTFISTTYYINQWLNIL